ncbi:MAG: transglycosylase SLT domain-containing protein [Candidatus Marinimicrobia bacterium]|nr:transglycosylase SLT domain-containing protein [Candidatus Neomarinimicrobiota bacterium]
MNFQTTFSPDNTSLLEQWGVYEQYHPIVLEAAEKYNIPWQIIAGVGSRESHWGLALKPKGPEGTGDFSLRQGSLSPDGLGWGKGLLQIDSYWHDFAKGDLWKIPQENIMYGVSLLSKNLLDLRRAALSRSEIQVLTDDGILRAAIAGYNAGISAIKRAICAGRSIDSCTTGRDYSADVLNLSGWFQEKALVHG